MRRMFLLALAVFVLSIAEAQTRFGLKGGLNLATVSGKDAKGASALEGFHAGALARIQFGGLLAFQPELLYSAQGSTLKVDVDGNDDAVNNVTARVHMHYISIPLMAQYHHYTGLYLETGPQLGLLVSAKMKAAGVKIEMKDDFEKLDIAWAFGVGYISDYNIGLNARYQYGFSRLGKPEADNPANRVYSRVFQVGVYYIIP